MFQYIPSYNQASLGLWIAFPFGNVLLNVHVHEIMSFLSWMSTIEPWRSSDGQNSTLRCTITFPICSKWRLILKQDECHLLLTHSADPLGSWKLLAHLLGTSVMMETHTSDLSVKVYNHNINPCKTLEQKKKGEVCVRLDRRVFTSLHLSEALWFKEKRFALVPLTFASCSTWINLQLPLPGMLCLLLQSISALKNPPGRPSQNCWGGGAECTWESTDVHDQTECHFAFPCHTALVTQVERESVSLLLHPQMEMGLLLPECVFFPL